MPEAAGPALPPHLLVKRKRKQEEDAAAATTTSTQPPPSKSNPPDSPKRQRVLGPSLPTAPLSERPEHPPSDSDSDSDSDYGPTLPTTSSIPSTTTLPTNDLDDETPPAPPPGQPTRDTWMTLPPTKDSLSSLDPARQRPRGFNTSKAPRPAGGAGPDARWTETPAEKRQRLQNEVLGIAPTPSPGSSSRALSDTRSQKRKEEEQATARRVAAQIEASRGPSLLERHQKKAGKEAEDDPSKRGFDWEKDMRAVPIPGRAEKKEMVDKAGGFGGRFSGGGFL